jgi:DNA gyrase/topoisomerase IV subunit B
MSGRWGGGCTPGQALAISGLSVVGRDRYGVFPLRGKLLNVRDATHQQIMNNVEINHVKQILGLQHGKTYTDSKSLRYGHLMIMTDQDHDGSHIKGLLINFLHHFFPTLLKVPGFLVEFITPIIKVTKGKQVHACLGAEPSAALSPNLRTGSGCPIPLPACILLRLASETSGSLTAFFCQCRVNAGACFLHPPGV